MTDFLFYLGFAFGPFGCLVFLCECLVLLVGENEVVVDWRSCIRRNKNSVHSILVWDHLEKKNVHISYLIVCLFDLGFETKICLVLIVGENEVVDDCRSCIRRSKKNVDLLLVWAYLEKYTNSLVNATFGLVQGKSRVNQFLC